MFAGIVFSLSATWYDFLAHPGTETLLRLQGTRECIEPWKTDFAGEPIPWEVVERLIEFIRSNNDTAVDIAFCVSANIHGGDREDVYAELGAVIERAPFLFLRAANRYAPPRRELEDMVLFFGEKLVDNLPMRIESLQRRSSAISSCEECGKYSSLRNDVLLMIESEIRYYRGEK